MKWEKRYEEMQKLIRKRRADSWVKGRYQIVTYAQDRFAVFAIPEYEGLIFERGERSVLKKMAPFMERAPPGLKEQFEEIRRSVLNKQDEDKL